MEQVDSLGKMNILLVSLIKAMELATLRTYWLLQATTAFSLRWQTLSVLSHMHIEHLARDTMVIKNLALATVAPPPQLYLYCDPLPNTLVVSEVGLKRIVSGIAGTEKFYLITGPVLFG